MRMNTTLKKKLFVPVIVMLAATLIVNPGCEVAEEQSSSSTPTRLSSTLVPNIPLDLYLYGKQDRPTVLPADMINASQDVSIETLAVWGASADDDFAFGLSITLTSAIEASKVYDEINLDKEGWKKLFGKTVFLVHGSGPAAKALKTAISNHDFKPYDDSEALRTAGTLPDGGTTKQAAIALVRPSENLIGFLTQDIDPKALNMINLVLKLVRLKVAAAGLYSPRHIDIAQVSREMESNGDITNLDLGLLILIKSGLPGFIVEPVVKKFLTKQDFTETSAGEVTVYRGHLDTEGGEDVPILVRIEGNRIFAAVSGQESYARTLLTSVHLK